MWMPARSRNKRSRSSILRRKGAHDSYKPLPMLMYDESPPNRSTTRGRVGSPRLRLTAIAPAGGADSADTPIRLMADSCSMSPSSSPAVTTNPVARLSGARACTARAWPAASAATPPPAAAKPLRSASASAAASSGVCPLRITETGGLRADGGGPVRSGRGVASTTTRSSGFPSRGVRSAALSSGPSIKLKAPPQSRSARSYIVGGAASAESSRKVESFSRTQIPVLASIWAGLPGLPCNTL
mmetsp:Transcript_515/g.1791  ORF Transcript_515/g.1791 Transcript_515/m.1791 type:complete len:242 (-) Transcript_515:7350-8075(-)